MSNPFIFVQNFSKKTSNPGAKESNGKHSSTPSNLIQTQSNNPFSSSPPSGRIKRNNPFQIVNRSSLSTNQNPFAQLSVLPTQSKQFPTSSPKRKRKNSEIELLPSMSDFLDSNAELFLQAQDSETSSSGLLGSNPNIFDKSKKNSGHLLLSNNLQPFYSTPPEDFTKNTQGITKLSHRQLFANFPSSVGELPQRTNLLLFEAEKSSESDQESIHSKQSDSPVANTRKDNCPPPPQPKQTSPNLPSSTSFLYSNFSSSMYADDSEQSSEDDPDMEDFISLRTSRNTMRYSPDTVPACDESVFSGDFEDLVQKLVSNSLKSLSIDFKQYTESMTSSDTINTPSSQDIQTQSDVSESITLDEINDSNQIISPLKIKKKRKRTAKTRQELIAIQNKVEMLASKQKQQLVVLAEHHAFKITQLIRTWIGENSDGSNNSQFVKMFGVLLTASQGEKLQQELRQNQNQLKYLSRLHKRELSRVKRGLNKDGISSTTDSAFNLSTFSSPVKWDRTKFEFIPDLKTNNCTMDLTNDYTAQVKVERPQQLYSSFKPETPLDQTPAQNLFHKPAEKPKISILIPARIQEETPESEDCLFVKTYGYWLNETENAQVHRNNLFPSIPAKDCTVEKVEWLSLNSINISTTPEAMAKKVFIETIDEYPVLFDIPFKHRKVQLAACALSKFITFDPMAQGLIGRKDTVSQAQQYYKFYHRDPSMLLPTEQLLDEFRDESSPLTPSWKFFPCNQQRIPFSSFEDARKAVEYFFADKLAKNNHSIPTLDQMLKDYQKGKVGAISTVIDPASDKFSLTNYLQLTSGSNWYQNMHNLIHAATCEQESETKIFMSLLATSSRNSSISQNTQSALQNYRSLSQGTRPRFGSYPYTSLINYLAGVLGRPSGLKISSFLHNLIAPSYSQHVTVDTHMTRYVLGWSGSLKPLEYAILEDFYRCASARCCEPLPHKFQAAIWTTLAGTVNFCSELLKYCCRCTFKIIPLPECQQSVGQEPIDKLMHFMQSSPQSMKKVEEFVRKRLVSFGYLNIPDPKCPPSIQNGFSLIILTPIREEHVSTMKSKLNLRKQYARKQNRNLSQAELLEKERIETTISTLEAQGLDRHINKTDQKWFDRDIRLINLWLGTLESANGDIDISECEESDEYFLSHRHFPGSKTALSGLYDYGGFWTECLEYLEESENI